MKKVNITIVSAILAIVLFSVLTIIQNKMINTNPVTTVLIAKKDIERDILLTEDMFSKMDVPVFLTLNNNVITESNEIIDKFAKERINKGQILFFDDIATKEELKILNAPLGLEKISLEIKESHNAVSFQVKPKDRVHLYFSGRYGVVKESISCFGLENIELDDNSMYTTCLLRDTEIIGIYDENGRSSENDKFSGIDTVVIAVDSNMAKLINNLKSQGNFDLTK